MPLISLVFSAECSQCPLCDRVDIPKGVIAAHIDHCRREREEEGMNWYYMPLQINTPPLQPLTWVGHFILHPGTSIITGSDDGDEKGRGLTGSH